MMILQSSDTPLSTPRIVLPTADSERSRDTIQKKVSSGNLLTPSVASTQLPSRNTSPAPTESEGVPVKICDSPSVCFPPLHSGYPSPALRPSFPTVVPGPYTPPRVVSPVSRMSTPRSLYESIPHLHGGLPVKPNAQSAQTVIAQTPVPIIIPQPHSFYSRSRSRSRSPARYRSPSSPPSRSRSRSTSRSRFRSRRFRTGRDYRSTSRSYSRSRSSSVVQCPIILPYNMSPRPRSHSRPPVRINTRDSSPTRANADSSLLSTPAFRPLPLHSLRPGDKTTTGMGALPPLPIFPVLNSGMGSNLGNNTKGYPNPIPMIPTPYGSHVWKPSSPFIPPAYPLPKVPGVVNNPSAQSTQPFQQATPSYHMSIPPAFPPGFIPVDPSFGPPPQWGPRGCTMTPDVAMPINYGNLKPHYRFFFSDGSLTVEVKDSLYKIHLAFIQEHAPLLQWDMKYGAPGACYGAKAHLKLHNVEPNQFELLLSLLYPKSFLKHEPSSLTDWFNVLHASSKLNMREIVALAVSQLTPMASAVQKIEWGNKYNVKEWLKPAYMELVGKMEELSVEEQEKVGSEGTSLIRELRKGLKEKIEKFVDRDVYY